MNKPTNQPTNTTHRNTSWRGNGEPGHIHRPGQCMDVTRWPCDPVTQWPSNLVPVLDYYTVWVRKIPPPRNFLTFSPNGWEFLVQILHAYYTFLSTLDYIQFLFNYLQRWRSYVILSATTTMCSKCPPCIDRNARWVVALNMA